MYRPLPPYLTVKQSNIEGLGLFATEKIIKNVCVGMSHITIRAISFFPRELDKDYIRTPLGGFLNHSTNPNIIKRKNSFDNCLYLVTLCDIEPDEELTTYYTLYAPFKGS